MRRDEGSALVETTFLAVVLLVPLTWFMVGVFHVQNAAYAAAAAAREAARAYVTTQGTDEQAGARAKAAAVLVLDDFGAGGGARVTVSGNLSPGAYVRATVKMAVPLPFLPSFLHRASVPVSAEAVDVVDEYR